MDGVVAAVFARGGSKGLPGKNLRRLGGTSLLARAIAQGQDLGLPVYVSTDDVEIAAEATRAGAIVPFLRPAELASDTAPERQAWRHLVQWIHDHHGAAACQVLLSLPAVAPLRDADDARGCLGFLEAHPEADIAVTVTPTDVHPSFNLVDAHDDGSVALVRPPPTATSRRQDLDPVFRLVPLAYAARADHVLTHDSIWQGTVVAHQVPAERAVDLDTPEDWDVVEARWRRWNDTPGARPGGSHGPDHPRPTEGSA